MYTFTFLYQEKEILYLFVVDVMQKGVVPLGQILSCFGGMEFKVNVLMKIEQLTIIEFYKTICHFKVLKDHSRISLFAPKWQN